MQTLEQPTALSSSYSFQRAQQKGQMKTDVLSFGRGNAKLADNIITFSLPAGHTCPGAHLCMSRANRQTGKITDGPEIQFRCYAASQEAMFLGVRESRWRNFELLKGKTRGAMFYLISGSLIHLNPRPKIVRIHVSGDFFSQDYFEAWILVASIWREVVFYGYTKMVPFLVSWKDKIPPNLHLVASRGGRFDQLIDYHGLRFTQVVGSTYEARKLGLPLDHDDTHCWKSTESFAHLIHGTQPPGTKAAKDWQRIRTAGGGYSMTRRKTNTVTV